MPELPEVEALRRAVETECKGRRIESVIVKESGGGPRDGLFDDAVFEGTTEQYFIEAVQAQRRGKYFWIVLSSGQHVLLHMGMTGSLVYKHKAVPQYRSFKVDEDWPPRYCKAEFIIEGDIRLAYTDPRRWGRITVKDDATAEPPISELAPDALLELPPLPDFIAKLRASRLPIKALLLDQQKVVSGVGNWVADENLFQARVDPAKPANRLTDQEIALIHEKLLAICEIACEANEKGEEFPEDWLFHCRWTNKAKGSKTKDGRNIVFETIGGRTTAIVPSLQRSKGGGEKAGEESARLEEPKAAKTKVPSKKKGPKAGKGGDVGAPAKSAESLGKGRKRKAQGESEQQGEGRSAASTKRSKDEPPEARTKRTTRSGAK